MRVRQVYLGQIWVKQGSNLATSDETAWYAPNPFIVNSWMES